MEVLRISPTHPPLLPQHHFYKTVLNPIGASPRSKPFIGATLSKPAVVATTSLENTLSVSSPSSPRPRVLSDSLQYPAGYVGAVPDRPRSNDNHGIINAMGYLTKILNSKVYDVAIESPLQLAPKLSESLGVNVWLKREDLQPVSCFFLLTIGF